MTATRRLTKRTVDALQPGERAWDSEVSGFGVRCQRRDKVFLVKTRIGGRQRWVTIGKHGSPWTVETARREALAILGDIVRGGDPKNSARDKAAILVSDLIDRFLTDHVETKRKPRTAVLYRDYLVRIVRPRIGKMLVAQVSHSDIARLHHELKDTPYQANRIIAVLSKMFSWAEQQGLRSDAANPCRHLEKYREQGRDRFLSQEELQQLGNVLADIEAKPDHNPYVIAALRLLILTGARLSEILTLKWSHVDYERGLLLLPDSKTGKKAITLNTAAIDVLKALPRIEGNPHVIVGNNDGAHLVNLQKPWRAIRKKADLEDVRIHDLRHTFASIAAASGASLLIIGKLLGHTQASTTQRYAHLAHDPVREMSQAVADRIGKNLSSRQGNSGHT